MCLPYVNTLRILCFVLVEDSITFIIVAFTNQPAKNMCWFIRIGNATFSSFAVQGSNVVFRNGTPVGFTRIYSSPAFYAGKQSLNSGAILANPIAIPQRFIHRPIGFQHGHQIFCPRKNKNIRFFRIPVAGQTLVCLACNRRERQIPAQPKYAISSTRIVVKG